MKTTLTIYFRIRPDRFPLFENPYQIEIDADNQPNSKLEADMVRWQTLDGRVLTFHWSDIESICLTPSDFKILQYCKDSPTGQYECNLPLGHKGPHRSSGSPD